MSGCSRTDDKCKETDQEVIHCEGFITGENTGKEHEQIVDFTVEGDYLVFEDAKKVQDYVKELEAGLFSEADVDAMYGPYKDQVNAVEGVIYDYYIKDGYFYETQQTDYKVADIKTLRSM